MCRRVKVKQAEGELYELEQYGGEAGKIEYQAAAALRALESPSAADTPTTSHSQTHQTTALALVDASKLIENEELVAERTAIIMDGDEDGELVEKTGYARLEDEQSDTGAEEPPSENRNESETDVDSESRHSLSKTINTGVYESEG